MSETQQSVSDWADQTFGPVSDWNHALRRTLEEVQEFLTAKTMYDIQMEMADVVITFCRLASVLGFDLEEKVNIKMAINRGRKWESDGTGHGYHIKE